MQWLQRTAVLSVVCINYVIGGPGTFRDMTSDSGAGPTVAAAAFLFTVGSRLTGSERYHVCTTPKVYVCYQRTTCSLPALSFQSTVGTSPGVTKNFRCHCACIHVKFAPAYSSAYLTHNAKIASGVYTQG
jgi:hypothetical protein